MYPQTEKLSFCCLLVGKLIYSFSSYLYEGKESTAKIMQISNTPFISVCLGCFFIMLPEIN